MQRLQDIEQAQINLCQIIILSKPKELQLNSQRMGAKQEHAPKRFVLHTLQKFPTAGRKMKSTQLHKQLKEIICIS